MYKYIYNIYNIHIIYTMYIFIMYIFIFICSIYLYMLYTNFHLQRSMYTRCKISNSCKKVYCYQKFEALRNISSKVKQRKKRRKLVREKFKDSETRKIEKAIEERTAKISMKKEEERRKEK